MSKELLFASSNASKIEEIRNMLPEGFTLLGLKDLNFNEEIEETGKTFEENAFLKANTLYEKFGKPCFADDSGLEIEILNKAPGVRSARFAGEPSDSKKNIAKVLEKLEGKTNRKARFVTVICLKTADKTLYFEGSIKGEITESESGLNGFGYDPIFKPEGSNITFAEMDAEEKNKISHRHKALVKMMSFIDFI